MMSTEIDGTPIEEKHLPKLPSVIVETILQLLESQNDLKNCRLVCCKWLYIIDTYIGLELKLNRTNKAKVFKSALIRSCTKLKVYASAGLTNWKVGVVLSPWNLKSVEILENILEENWSLLLTQCKGIQYITMTPHLRSLRKTTQMFSRKENSFVFGDKIKLKIDHCSLRRLFFKEIRNYNSERERNDFTSVANMMNAIGIAPQLRQIVILYCSSKITSSPNDDILKSSLLTLMQRNPRINSFGFVELYCTSFQEMKLWDKFLEEDRSFIAHSSGVYNGWTDLFDKMLNISTLYYGIFDDSSWTGFSTFIDRIMRESRNWRNLKTLYLSVGSFWDEPWVFNCSDIYVQQVLQNLKELTLRIFYCSSFDPSNPILQNLNILTSYNTLLEYLDISMQLTQVNLTTIFNIPKLAELHIRLQKSAAVLKDEHCRSIQNHPTLKLIFWQNSFQRRWTLLKEGETLNWRNVQMKPKKFIQYRCRAKGQINVMTTDDGFFSLETWNRNQFSSTSALFNIERITDSDRDKLREDY